VMDALHLESVFLLGASMGTYIAQGVAIQQPQRVKKLVLVTPKAHGKTSSSARFLAEHAEELEGMSDDEVQMFLFKRVFAPTTAPEVMQNMVVFAQQQYAAGLFLTPEQTLAANRALEGFDFRPGLPQVTAETLVISGRYDPLNPPADGREIADLIPNARFVVLEHSGHVVSLEEPQRLLELVETFFNG
jgi:3-oxoadipate enol-lactonase